MRRSNIMGAPGQYSSFSANCTTRGCFDWLLTTPKPGAPKLCPGGAKRGVFVKLNASARTCRCSLSRIRVSLISDMSMSRVPSSRRPEYVRGALPNAYAGGALNCDASNHNCGVGSESLALLPLQLGRCPPPCEKVLFTADV